MAATDLLSPAIATRARDLEFFARTRVEGFLKSINASRLRGASTDFLQHRQYLPGDDLRNLDWRIFARSDRLVTREYEEYTNLDVMLMIDASGSMGYGSGESSKLDVAVRAAAMLAYILQRQKDRFGLAVLAQGLDDYLPPGGSRRHMGEICRRMAAIEPGGETALESGLTQLMQRRRRRGVCVLFSDGYQDPETLVQTLGTLTLRGHDVIFYQICDPDEDDLPFTGYTLFRDLETGQLDGADPLAIAAAFRDVAKRHSQALRDGAARFGIECSRLPATRDWDNVLATLLRGRVARA